MSEVVYSLQTCFTNEFQVLCFKKMSACTIVSREETADNYFLIQLTLKFCISQEFSIMLSFDCGLRLINTLISPNYSD